MHSKCQLIKDKFHGRGHKVSNSNHKTNRMFKLNLQNIRFFSYSLGVYVSTSVPNRTVRTVDKFGGLDAFLLAFSKRKMTPFALSLRSKVAKKKPEEVARLVSEAVARRTARNASKKGSENITTTDINA